MAYLKGIDVSAWQREIDWRAIGGTEISFAWMRASVGVTPDEYFAANWSGALYLASIARGAYHFLTSGTSAEAQARAFLRVYPGGGELPAVLDLERGLDGSAPRVDDALIWRAIVARELGSMPMIYVSPSFAEEHKFHEFPELRESDLWIAHWDPKKGKRLIEPWIPRPWAPDPKKPDDVGKTWRAWQRGTMEVPGIHTGPVDYDELRAWE